MSSKSKTLFQGLPKCSQVPADGVSFDSGTLTLLLKMRAVGCHIPQCGSASECELMPRANRAGFKLNEGAKVQIWLLPRTIVVGVGVFDVNFAR